MPRSNGARCPNCGSAMSVYDTRPTKTPDALVWRRRKCLTCEYRCTTHEVIVQDALGFANADRRRARLFLSDVEKSARQHFGDDKGFFTFFRDTDQ